jgi:3-oxoacyl-[acyl-carrier protein] reductase
VPEDVRQAVDEFLRGRQSSLQRSNAKEAGMLLQDKNAVVYGAGPIGSSVARTFAREGAHVFMAGHAEAPVRSVTDEINGSGGVAAAAVVDALDEDAIERHMDDVVAQTGRIDILFNAIGLDDVQGTLLVDMSLEDFAKPVIKATQTQFLTARAAARRMQGQGSGVIMSITVAPSPEVYHGGFGVACATIEGLWRSFAAELGPQGIRLVIIRSAGSPDAPDIKETFERHARASGITTDEFLAQASSGTLLKRLPTLSEVADAAAMMASDRASAMTATMANVTCGYWVDV